MSSSGSDGEREEQEVEETIDDPTVYNKYAAASDIVNNTIKALLADVVAGKKITELCQKGDTLITESLSKVFASKKALEKGIAFPTCISLNNIAGNVSPLDGDATVLQDGDVVKIDLGAHIGGHIVVGAHTTIVGSSASNVATGKKADVICAAYLAAEVALRLLKPGAKNTDITKAIAKVAEEFHVAPLEGVLTHQMKKHVIDGAKVIMSKTTPEQTVKEETIEENEVYALDIVMSTGDGKTRIVDEKATTVFKRNVDSNYGLKMKTARTLFNDITRNHPALPFSLRAIADKKARFGMTELLNHALVYPLHVVQEKPGEIIAQFKFTVLVTATNTRKMSNLPLPYVQSQYSLQDPELKALSTAPTTSKKRKQAEKETPPALTTTPTPMDTSK